MNGDKETIEEIEALGLSSVLKNGVVTHCDGDTVTLIVLEIARYFGFCCPNSLALSMLIVDLISDKS